MTTSLGDRLKVIRNIIGVELSAQLKPFWVLNEESEPSGVWRNDFGVENLWYAFGTCLWDSYWIR
jgi:hypothetical protein